MYVATMPVARFNGARDRGLGDAVSASRNVQIGGSVAASGAVAALGTIAAHIGATGSILGITGATMTAAIPIVGAGLAAATMLVQYLVANSGCGQTCIETSSWANQAAAALQKVMDGYFALPAPRTETQKALAVASFNDIWNQLVQACGQPGTGNAGVRCISDRQAGACTWKQKYPPVYPGQPEVGACWNWFNGYLAPIQQDPVVPDPLPADALTSAAASVSGSLDSILGASGAGLNILPLLVIGGLVLLAVKS
jgi:hypothetical protein